MPLRAQQTRRALIISAAIAIYSGCAGNSSDAYVDHTDDPLLESADGRLRDADVECQLDVMPGSESEVRMTLANQGRASIDILKRGTMWDRLNRVLDISVNGHVAKYMGIVATLNPPSEAEWVRLAPGETLSVSYDVGLQHQLEEPGQYEIALASPLLSVRKGSVPLALQHDCGTLHAYLSPADRNGELGISGQALIYNDTSCPTDTQAKIEAIESRAQTAATVARQFSTTNNSLFSMWFGTWSSSNSTYVDNVLSNIQGGWATFTGDCDATAPASCGGGDPCSSSASAWTCAGADANLVHICTTTYFFTPQFSIEASSNQLGILVHEKSHLVSGDGDQTNAVCTDDGSTSCYGAQDARALAIAAPAQAIKSGENYEHFASDAYFVGVMLQVIM